MTTRKIDLDPADPLKHFSYFREERRGCQDAAQAHPLDRLFLRDPLRFNVRQTFRLSIPIIHPDDRAAANEVTVRMRLMYRMSQNHLRMFDYAHTVRLYDEIHRHVLRTEPSVDEEDQN